MKPSRTRLLLVVGMLLLLAGPRPGAAANALGPDMPNLDEFVVYSAPGAGGGPASAASKLWPETPRHGLNDDGLIGHFAGATADKLAWSRMFFAWRYKFHSLNSHLGETFRGNDKGWVHTFQAAVNYLGEWAEWAVVVPVHQYLLEAPRTFSAPVQEDTGLGDMKLALKFTYLPDRSYYRFAYGAVVTTTTGHPDRLRPTGVRGDGELKVFGAVTTRETARAALNLELGEIMSARGDHNRFHYRIGMSWEAGTYTSLITEFAGEVEGGDDRDTLDWILGARLAPSRLTVLELSYTKNLRTYREFGYDEELSLGMTIRW